MSSKAIAITRTTKETDITLSVDLARGETPRVDIQMNLPFFSHMLHAFAYHGGFHLSLTGTGDIDVDPHHLVEDVGIVLGQGVYKLQEALGPTKRFGHQVIPMDDALSEAVVDCCNRAYLVYKADFPQTHSGSFDMSLFQEFFTSFVSNSRINLHLHCRYGVNSHHMIEALFKAMGRALGIALTPLEHTKQALSTKGKL